MFQSQVITGRLVSWVTGAAIVLTLTAVIAGPGAQTATAGSAPTGYTAVNPQRLLDTRVAPKRTLTGGHTITLGVTGTAHVPASGVTAVVLNVIGIAHTHSAYLTVFPTGATRPTASNLNVVPEVPVANSVIATVGTGGTVSIFNSAGSTDVVVDLRGYFSSSSSFVGQAPSRVVDTRSNAGLPLAAKTSLTVPIAGQGGVPPSGVSDVVVNLTGVSTAGSAYLTVYQGDEPMPAISNLNLAAKQTSGVLVVAHLDASGALTVYNSGGPTHVIVDVLGWFTGNSDYTPITPTRLVDTRLTGLNSTAQLHVTGVAGIPAGAGAAVLSVTAVKAGTHGFLTVYPASANLGSTSDVNVPKHGTVANLVVAQLSPSGEINIHDFADADVIVDVMGWLDTNTAVSTDQLPNYSAMVTQPFSSQTPTVAGGIGSHVWSLVSGGTLPAGLSLTSDGEVTGTPTQVGITTAYLQVTDAVGVSAPATLSVHVYPFVHHTIWGWGEGDHDLLPAATEQTPVLQPALSAVTDIANGPDLALAAKPDGTVWVWGFGYLGNGQGQQPAPAVAPVQVPGLTSVIDVAEGASSSYVLKSDGTVWQWGLILGIHGGNAKSPVEVPGLTGITAIGASSETGYALKSDGTVWAWGSGTSGQLGNGGSAGAVETPVQVQGLTNVNSIAASGQNTAYAVTSDGHLYSWGADNHGQLGDGSVATDSKVPVQVSGLTNVVSVGAGDLMAFAAESDGSAWAWGYGLSGRLGTGSDDDAMTPVQITGLSDIINVAGTAQGGYAVTSTGAAYSWGWSANALLGNGFPVSPSREQNPPGLMPMPPVSAISASPLGLSAFAIGRA